MLVVGGFVSCKEIGVSGEWWPPARFSLSQWLLDQTQSLLSSLELVMFSTWNLFILKFGRFAAVLFWRALFYCVYCFLNPTLVFTIIWRELGVFFAAFDNRHFQIFDEISPWQNEINFCVWSWNEKEDLNFAILSKVWINAGPKYTD